MKELNEEYIQRLDDISADLQENEIYTKYLDEEEEEDYQALREIYEPQISEIYEEVSDKHPLQLLAFEEYLLDEKFEGMFLPRILGYAVLRGVHNDDFIYIRPQEHFKNILMAICNSSNFDYLKKRIGQTIQIGFAMSSDIWITSLINEFANKKIRYFLQGQKLHKYRVKEERNIGYKRYKNQFRNENFFSTVFPTTVSELKILYPSIKNFIYERTKMKVDNSSLIEPLDEFIARPEFFGLEEQVLILGLYIHYFDNEKDSIAGNIFNRLRKEKHESFSEEWFTFIKRLDKSELDRDHAADNRVSGLLDRTHEDKLKDFYDLTDEIHKKGHTHQDSIDAVATFYNKNAGMSDINECVRKTIYGYIGRLMAPLEESDYPDYFEISKIFPVYIGIFDNQQFNKDIKDLSMGYVRKLLKRYTDKRGKDYQDIKKFVATNFVDLGFLKEKEVVELFKTRRKRKKPVS